MTIYSVHNCDLLEYDNPDDHDEYVKMVTYEEAQKEIAKIRIALHYINDLLDEARTAGNPFKYERRALMLIMYALKR